MVTTRKGKGKAPTITISSSSSESESESEEESSGSEEYSDEDFDDQEAEASLSEENSSSGSSSHDEEVGKPKSKLNEEDSYAKITSLLQGGKSLNALRLEECKAYLRKHELMVSGAKETCIKRILEHWRIKDGNGQKLYPQSSFVINCTGDVCKGDTVLFKQRVYEKFDIVTRGGRVKIIGKRIIAGRVLKESYGAAKQQHTFTVEVLWSKGVKALPPLYPLRVKGRNLYRMKTFRQCWSNEAERSLVLNEKHKRGAAARHVRAIAKSKAANRGSKRQIAPPSKRNTKNHKESSKAPPSKRRKKGTEPANKQKKPSDHAYKAPSNGYLKTKQVTETGNFASLATHPNQASYDVGHAQYPLPQRKKDLEPANIQKKLSDHVYEAPSNGYLKTRQATESGNFGSSATHTNQASYHGDVGHAQYPLPQRIPYPNYSHTPVAETRNFGSLATHPNQASYSGNVGRIQYPPQRIPYTNYSHTPMVSHQRNDIIVSQENRRMFQFPNHHDVYSSTATSGVPHHYLLNRGNYIRDPYGDPYHHFDPRRQDAYDSMVSRTQFHGGRRP